MSKTRNWAKIMQRTVIFNFISKVYCANETELEKSRNLMPVFYYNYNYATEIMQL